MTLTNTSKLSFNDQFLSYFERLNNYGGTKPRNELFLTIDPQGQGGEKVRAIRLPSSVIRDPENLPVFEFDTREGKNIYILANLVRGQERKKSDILAIRALYIDLDLEKSGIERTPAGDYCLDSLFDELPQGLKPHMAVDSGHGVHLYWVLPQRIKVQDSPEIGARVEAIMKRLVQRLKEWGADPACADIARVLRVPGYKNFKPDDYPGEEPPTARLVCLDKDIPAIPSNDYLSQFEQWLPELVATVTIPKNRTEGQNKPKTEEPAFSYNDDNKTIIKKALVWLANKEDSNQGENGSGALMAACWVGPFFGLSQEKTLELIQEHYQEKCDPEWSEADIVHKIHDVYLSAEAKPELLGCKARTQAEKDQLITFEEMQAFVEQTTRQTTQENQAEILDCGKYFSGELSRYELNDCGLINRIVKRYKDKLLYHDNAWHFYNGKIWDNSLSEIARKLIDQTINYVKTSELREFFLENKEKPAKLVEYKNWVRVLSSSRIRGSIEKELRHHLEKSVVFDDNPSLLNFQDGTWNCKTLKLQEHSSGDYQSKILPDSCPQGKPQEGSLWLRTLGTIFDGNIELINYVQRLVGMTVCSGSDEKIIFLQGEGSNGKSVFLNSLASVLGPYSRAQNSQLILNTNNGDQFASANLIGCKLAYCNEMPERALLSEQAVKQLASRGKLSVRQLYSQSEELEISYHIWIACNHLPLSRDLTNSITRRIEIIPFNHVFLDNEMDVELEKKLNSPKERQAILAWILEGIAMYNTEGIVEKPEAVRDANNKWREDCDWFSRFLNANFIQEPGARCPKNSLWPLFLAWRDQEQEALAPNFKGSFFHEVEKKFSIIKSCGKHYVVGLRHRFDDAQAS